MNILNAQQIPVLIVEIAQSRLPAETALVITEKLVHPAGQIVEFVLRALNINAAVHHA